MASRSAPPRAGRRYGAGGLSRLRGSDARYPFEALTAWWAQRTELMGWLAYESCAWWSPHHWRSPPLPPCAAELRDPFAVRSERPRSDGGEASAGIGGVCGIRPEQVPGRPACAANRSGRWRCTPRGPSLRPWEPDCAKDRAGESFQAISRLARGVRSTSPRSLALCQRWRTVPAPFAGLLDQTARRRVSSSHENGCR